MLLYNPGSADVAVVDHSEPESHRVRYGHLLMSCGACYAKFDGLSMEGKMANILLESMQAIIRDKVDPMALHEALCCIEEYRENIAGDVPGSDRDPADWLP